MHDNLVNVAPASVETPQSLYRKSYEKRTQALVIGSLRGFCIPLFSTGDEAVQRMRVRRFNYKSAKRGKAIAFK